jgi:formylglycine-generating enzyme required for sulfatase activity
MKRIIYITATCVLSLLHLTVNAQSTGNKQAPEIFEHKSISTSDTAGNTIVNSIGMKLKLVPAGSFIMGSNNGGKYEKPIHRVTISKPFYMGVYEVTQTQYEKVMGKNPSHYKGSSNPVEEVSWNEAIEFCRRLSKMEGKTYRLPTEAEWEYACRAGSQADYCFEKPDDTLSDYAWYVGNSGRSTKSVGKKKPNGFSLCDMHGNVCEWCMDRRGSYPEGSVTDPTGPRIGSRRVFRGGDCHSDAGRCRSAYRSYELPGNKRNYIGFRVVLASQS